MLTYFVFSEGSLILSPFFALSLFQATSSDDLTISCNIQGIKGWRRCKKGDKLIVRDGCRRRRLCPKLPKQYFKVTCQNTATITFRTNGAGELGGFCCTVTANVPETTTTEAKHSTKASIPPPAPSPPPQTPSPPPQTLSPPPILKQALI
ncbi:uncharacterized protein LOC122243903 [Penaeus japonicus]|uniref:uncharacterized protein LOC122243903 n=1 Tax=Penaeus japonicus TaxID=27405 RepID=UPI001C7144D8|nr:uncharacterized protein LOC122243903 [Penaeus japonicus]